MKWIAHVYLTNFYLSVQQIRRPELGQEAAVLLRHNRVIDLSPLAEAQGVKMRSSRRHAYLNCPNALFFDYAAEEYREAADQVLDSCLAYTPVIEPVSENEFYLELAGPQQPDQVVRELTSMLVPEFAAALSIGIGCNKFLARLAHMMLAAGRVNQGQPNGDIPAGKFYWLKQAAAEVLAALPVFYLWPLDADVTERLRALGLGSIGQIQTLSMTVLQQEFGAKARQIKELAVGSFDLPVASLYPPKQLVREVKFPGTIVNRAALEQSLLNLAADLHNNLSRREEGCRRLVLHVTTEEGLSIKTRTFNRVQNNLVTLQEVLKSMAKTLPLGSPVQALGVTADDLRPLYGVQLSLFEDPKALAGQDKAWQDKLNNLLDNLGRKFAPQNFHLAKDLVCSRREQMLQIWDPLRFTHQR